MKCSAQSTSVRWFYLVTGVVAMLFAGIIYGWSILNTPFSGEFGWGASGLALNFTLTMCFFCLGALAGGIVSKGLGCRLPIIAAGIAAGAGFVLTSTLDGSSVVILYLTYGVLAGFGIGVAYNVILSTVGAWFPDKKGMCSGALLMGFGASALVLGSLVSSFMENPAIGWRKAYVILGIALGAVLIITGLVLKRPAPDSVFPQRKKSAAAGRESFEPRDYTSGEMLRRPSFWMAFICLVFLAAVGSSVISFARNLALSVGAAAGLATTLVGVLSVCNGLGRIITGFLFDALGRRKTMLAANILTIAAAMVTLLSVLTSSLPLCVAGLCLVGLSYGSCPTLATSFTLAFYGSKHYSTNLGYINFNIMGGSIIASLSSALLTATGAYLAPFCMLLALAVAALVLNIFIRRP